MFVRQGWRWSSFAGRVRRCRAYRVLVAFLFGLAWLLLSRKMKNKERLRSWFFIRSNFSNARNRFQTPASMLSGFFINVSGDAFEINIIISNSIKLPSCSSTDVDINEKSRRLFIRILYCSTSSSTELTLRIFLLIKSSL